MSSACEDGVALLIQKILGNKYNYIVDCYLSYGRGKLYRPDIVIVDTKNGQNEIVAFVEVKAQMGYCGILSPSMFTDRLKGLKKCKLNISDGEYDQLGNKAQIYYKNMGFDVNAKDKCINFSVSKKVHVFVVNVMASNHIYNVEGTMYRFMEEDASNIHFYNLYGAKDRTSKEGKRVWYNNVCYENIYEKTEGDKQVNIPIRKNKKIVDTIEYKLTDKIREQFGFDKFVRDISKIL